MSGTSFRAMVVEENGTGGFVRSIKKKEISNLPKGDVLIKVQYSSATLSSIVGLDDLEAEINKILAGEQIGHRVIRMAV